MQFRRLLFILYLFPFFAQAQPYTLKEVSLPGDPSSSILYSVINIPGGWASTGRAVLPNEESYGMLIIFQNNKEQIYTLKAGVQCRLYNLLADSDSTLITAGYIKYEKNSLQRALLARWDLQGRLIDSVSSTIDGKDWMMLNDLVMAPDNFIYGICMVREDDISYPWLLKFDSSLKMLQHTRLPGQATNTGVEAKIIKGYNDSSFFYCVNDKDSCLLAAIDLNGRTIKKRTVKAPYDFHYLREGDVSEPYFQVFPGVFDLNYRNKSLYLSGTARNSSWVGKFNDSLSIQASLITQSPFYESGGTLLFTGKQCWLSSQVGYEGIPYRPILYLLDDSLLTIKQLVYTNTPSRMLFATSLPDGNFLFTGAKVYGEKDKAAYGIMRLAERSEKISAEVDWSSLDGPPGADATALSIDKKGNYWLGTGSSGGVYYSADKGSSWEPRLKGLGPMHVNGLFWRNDTLFAKVSDMRLSERTEVDQRDKEIFFYLKNGKGEWKYYKKRENYYSLNRSIREENIRKFNYYNEQFPLQKTSKVYSRLISHYKAWGVDFKNEGFDLFTHEFANRFGNFYPLDSNLVELNKHFPADVFEGERNIEMDGDRMILLAKSGLYFSEKAGALQPAPVKGLVATDVRQLREGPKGDIYALVGTHEIWKLKNKEWTLWFDGNEHLTEYGKDTAVTGYDIPYFDISANDELAFSYGGDAWKVTSEGKAQLMKAHGEWLKTEDGTPDNVNLFGAAITADGREVFVGASEGNIFRLYQQVGDELMAIIDTKSEAFCYLYTDKAGETWFVGDSIYRLDATGYRALLKNDLGISFVTHIASNHKGKLVLMSKTGCLLFDPQTDQWQLINMNPPLIEGSQEQNYFSAVAIDDDDQIYTGTAPWYSVMCGFGVEGYPSGIYRHEGYFMSPLKNNINSWILSVECDKEGRVLAGTAGSGVITSTHSIHKKTP